MPSFLTIGPYRFFCYAGDRDEPPHVHIERDQAEAKFWLIPVRLQKSRGFNRKEINRIQKRVEEHQEELLESWHDFFND
jgi:hypothetical protein